MILRVCLVLAAVALAGAVVVGASADSTPIGVLPAGPAATIDVRHGELFALALPQRSAGQVWRIARRYDSSVVRQRSEANVGRAVVLVFHAEKAGSTVVSLALTKGDTSGRALESRRFVIRVR